MNVESDQSELPHPISEADFVRLFARHELALRNYARLILPDWNGVDDVLQDASITMWENLSRTLTDTSEQARSDSSAIPIVVATIWA